MKVCHRPARWTALLRLLAGTCLAAPLPALGGDIVVHLDPPPIGATAYAALYAADSADWGNPLARLSAASGDLVFKDIDSGRYAIQVFVDSDGDGALATSPRGMPREPVGLSTNPGLLKGKPTPKRCAFVHDAARDSHLDIQLRHSR